MHIHFPYDVCENATDRYSSSIDMGISESNLRIILANHYRPPGENCYQILIHACSRVYRQSRIKGSSWYYMAMICEKTISGKILSKKMCFRAAPEVKRGQISYKITYFFLENIL